MAPKLTTFEQARQQAQSSKEYTDAMVAEVAEAAAESIQEVAEQLPITTSITLPASGWSGNSQAVAVEGVTADNTIIVSASAASQSAYSEASVSCTAQAAGTLTFTCSTAPSTDLTVDLIIIP